MNKIDSFVKSMLYNKGINGDDLKELELEIKEHLLLSKEEYIVNGYTENEAIDMTIKNFGNKDEIAQHLKKSLASNNKYKKLELKQYTSCIISMSLVFLIISTILHFSFYKYETTLLFNILVTLAPLIISFLYVNIKTYSKKSRIIGLILINISFMLISILFKISLPLIKLTFTTALCYLSFSLIFIIITTFLSEKLLSKLRNPYSGKLLNHFLFCFSIIFILFYTYIVSSNYRLFRLFEEINHQYPNINNLTRNIFYSNIDNALFIPNIGLLILIALFIKLIYTKYVVKKLKIN